MKGALLGILVATVGWSTGVLAEEHNGKHAVDLTCARTAAIQEFKEAVLAKGAAIDSVHVRDGIAVVVTAGSPEGSTAIEAARQKYATFQAASVQEKKSMGAAKRLAGACEQISQAIADGRITEETTPFGAGILFLITSRDSKLRVIIQDNDCCNWCGPCDSHSTAGCCRRC